MEIPLHRSPLKIIHKYRNEIVQYYEDGTSFDVNDKSTEIACRPGSRIMIKTETEKPFTNPKLINLSCLNSN